MQENNILSEIGQYLPNYLTPKEKHDLVAGLKDFPDYFNYYLQGKFQKEALQGDIWDDFTVINFNTGERKNVRGVILSNSCDIDVNNPRSLPVHVTFAPLIKLEKLETLLRYKKQDNEVNSIIENIKSQKNTSFIYFPENTAIQVPESVVYLNDLHSMPIGDFSNQARKIITLTQQGFYLFILKLSIHFSRFQEGITRF